ncbi:MAG: HAMP domain-containing sensor histidine kinase [Bacillota bacterium]|nr:HAMP domain-containing sensor histidine kinase [Bacillota bacterium]
MAEPDRQSYYDVLYQEIGLLERLIQDLTDLNVLRNEKYPLRQEEINVMDVLKDAIRSQRLIAREKNITLVEEFAGEACYILGDYARIRQMFVIVLNNAIKYSAAGAEVSVVYDRAASSLSITNTGEDIGADSLSRIFEPFYRDRNTKEKGTGLGLSIAKTIADRQGITIKASSVGGQTSFCFTMQTVQADKWGSDPEV